MLRYLKTIGGLTLLGATLSGCPDTDALGLLPEPIELESALLVPTEQGILVFPIGDDPLQPIEPPVGFFGDPGAVGDIAQRKDGTLVCTNAQLTISIPEGFIVEPDGDVLREPPDIGTLVNLDDSPRLLFPTSVVVLPDESIVISDLNLGSAVEHFDADGKLLGPLTNAINFSNPLGLTVIDGDILVIDPSQEPRLFRFAQDGTFKGAFTADTTIISPVGAAAAQDGTLFVADSTLNAVLAFDSAGQILEFEASAGLGVPSDIELLPGGQLVVADIGNDDLGITPGIRVYGAAGNLTQQIAITSLVNDDALRVAVVSQIVAHPAR